MEIKYDVNANKVYLGGLTNEDLAQTEEIRATMRTKGWQWLMKYWSYAREAIIESGIRQVKAGDTDKSPEKWARLDGFQEAMAIPDRLLKRADTELEARQNARNTDEE